MTTVKKNQHYVPKFYLRNFSFRGNEKQIGVFNCNSNFFHQTGKLKTQASKNFYYGTDGKLEDMLSDVEGVLASEIRTIISDSKLPEPNTYGHETLLALISITNLRNPVLIDHVKASTEHMKERLLELHSDTNTDELIPEISHEKAVSIAMSGLKSIVDHIQDLEYKLLINNTEKPFITSDFPIVRYNSFLEGKKWERGKTGYASVGLQIFLPINPKLTLMFYDQNIYRVGTNKGKKLELTKKNDIDQLNLLQYLNCLSNVYFNDKATESYIKDLHKKSMRYQKANVSTSKLAFMVKQGNYSTIIPNEKDKNLVIIGSTDCEIKLNLEGVKVHSKGKKYVITDMATQMRKNSINIYKRKNR